MVTLIISLRICQHSRPHLSAVGQRDRGWCWTDDVAPRAHLAVWVAYDGRGFLPLDSPLWDWTHTLRGKIFFLGENWLVLFWRINSKVNVAIPSLFAWFIFVWFHVFIFRTSSLCLAFAAVYRLVLCNFTDCEVILMYLVLIIELRAYRVEG